jgi:hypothetical protein
MSGTFSAILLTSVLTRHRAVSVAGAAPADVAFVEEALQKAGGPTVPTNFVQTAPAYDPQSRAKRGNMPRVDLHNPQTTALLDMLGLR